MPRSKRELGERIKEAEERKALAVKKLADLKARAKKKERAEQDKGRADELRKIARSAVAYARKENLSWLEFCERIGWQPKTASLEPAVEPVTQQPAPDFEPSLSAKIKQAWDELDEPVKMFAIFTGIVLLIAAAYAISRLF